MLAKPQHFEGASPNSLALSPDGNALYVTDGGTNALAVVPLADPAHHRVAGLVPTGWYPNSVSAVGDMLYVVNGRSNVRANKTRGYDWSKEDRIPAEAYNRILWAGLAGNEPYPAVRDGKDRSLPISASRER